MKRLRTVVIVSSDPSDIFFANQLVRRLNVVGLLIESQAEPNGLLRRVCKGAGYILSPWQIPRLLRERAIVNDHVRRTSLIDKEGFGWDGYDLSSSPSYQIINLEGKNAVNKPETLECIRTLAPDLLVLCGCSILSEQVLSLPKIGALNLHGGLAQKYRGIWTTLWALVNEEPEYIGATVHFVTPGIDDGDIVYQGRPAIDVEDNCESLYVKVVKLGVEMMIAAVEDVENERVQRYPLEQKGILYKSRMVTPEILQKVWALTEAGVISRYLMDKAERDSCVLGCMRGVYRSSGV